MAYVSVDVSISEFDTYELVDELIDRLKSSRKSKQISEKQKQELAEELKDMFKFFKLNIVNEIDTSLLVDKMKLEHIIEVFNKYSINDLETRLPK